MAVIAIDFDGVIHDYKHPVAGKRMGAPFAEAEEMIDELRNRGHEIIVFTVKARTPEGKEAVEEWLEFYTIDAHSVTALKPNGDIFIDDKAIRHDNWFDTMKQIDALTHHFE